MSVDPWAETAGVVRHPALDAVAGDALDRGRLDAFAWDLAAWLRGAPRAELGALARVVTAVLARDLELVRLGCSGSSLMSVEAGASGAVALWPLLRDPGDPGEAAVAEEEPVEGAEGGGGGPGGGAGEGGGGPGRGWLSDLADGADVDAPELDALRRQAPGELPDHLRPVAGRAWQAALEAEALARTVERLVPGVGWGTAPRRVEEALLRDLRLLSDLIGRLPELTRLAELVGRAEASGARAGVLDGGSEEVVGVRVGGEVAWALPSELGLLGDPETEDLFYQRLIEHRLIALELAGGGLEGVGRPEKRGPVIACIDTSGSMSGPPEVLAKALVLAVCRKVLPEGRTVHLLQFGAADELSEVRLRAREAGLDRFLAFLARGFRGGTDFDTPLLRALDLLEEEALQRADVVVVTDGLAMAGPEVLRRVREAREVLGLRVWTVLIGSSGRYAVEGFSDHVWVLEEGEAAGVKLVAGVARGLA